MHRDAHLDDIDRYLDAAPKAEDLANATFATLPDLEVPSRAEEDRA